MKSLLCWFNLHSSPESNAEQGLLIFLGEVHTLGEVHMISTYIVFALYLYILSTHAY